MGGRTRESYNNYFKIWDEERKVHFPNIVAAREDAKRDVAAYHNKQAKLREEDAAVRKMIHEFPGLNNDELLAQMQNPKRPQDFFKIWDEERKVVTAREEAKRDVAAAYHKQAKLLREEATKLAAIQKTHTSDIFEAGAHYAELSI